MRRIKTIRANRKKIRIFNLKRGDERKKKQEQINGKKKKAL